MSEEMLDLVDELDNVIGTVERSEANANPSLIHREIGVLVVDGNHRVLMQQRSSAKKVAPLMWIVSVAGHVPTGIDPLATAHNELQEELGFDTELTFSEKYLLKMPNETVWAYMYVANYEGQEIKPDPLEIEQYKFFTQDEWNAFEQTDADIDPDSSRIAKEYWASL